MKIWDDLRKIGEIYSAEEMTKFRVTFPEFSDDLIDKLFYSSITPLDSLIYFDEAERIIFETQIYKTSEGFKMLMPNDEIMTPLEVIKFKREEFKKQLAEGNIDYLAECVVPLFVSNEFIALVNMKGYFLHTRDDDSVHKEIIVETDEGLCSEGYINVRNEIGTWFIISKDKFITV